MRNKKTIAWGLALAAVPLLAATLAFAQGSNGERMQALEEKKDELKGNLGQVREETKEKVAENRTQRIEALKKLMQVQINRAERALTRLSNILDRIQTRRDKLAAGGTDVASVDEMIQTAKDQKAAVQEAVDKAKADLAAIDGSADTKGAVRTFMKSMNDLKKDLIGLHKTMKETVKEMRKIAPKEEKDSAEGDDSGQDQQPESN